MNSNLFLALAATNQQSEQQPAQVKFKVEDHVETNSPNFNNNKYLQSRKFKGEMLKIQKDSNEIEFFN